MRILNLNFGRRRESMAAAGPCFHCGLPLPEPVSDWVGFDGAQRPVCCAACAAVAQMVIGAGQGDYYRKKSALAADPHGHAPA